MTGIKIGNLEVYGIIYKIENLVNHKVYIGQTTRGFKSRYIGNNNTKPIEWVYRAYNYYMDKKPSSCNKHILKSINKYGFDNFSVNQILDIAFSKEELDIKEKCWIKIYNSTNSNFGYNIQNGGQDISTLCSKNRKYTDKQIVEAKYLFSKGKGVTEVYNKTGIKFTTLHLIKEFKQYKYIGQEYNEYIKSKITYPKEDIINYYNKCKDYKLTADNFNYTIPVIKKIINKYINELNGRYKICSKCNKKFLIHKNERVNSNRKKCYKCSPPNFRNKIKNKRNK